MPTDNVFLIAPSFEEHRPTIDFTNPCNRSIDWYLVGEVLSGNEPVEAYQRPSILVVHDDWSDWDYYSVPGTFGLMSSRAVTKLPQESLRMFDVLEASLNDVPFFFLRQREQLDCFDRENAETMSFRANPARIKEVRKYAFKKNIPEDPLLFSVPEVPELFATDGPAGIVSSSDMKGFLVAMVA